MILVAAVVVAALAVPVFGGRLRDIIGLRLRSLWLVFTAVGMQALIGGVLDEQLAGWVGRALHLASYGLLDVFLYRNRRVRGLLVLAVGGAMNLAAITANGGVMPTTARALELAGRSPNLDERFSTLARSTARAWWCWATSWPGPRRCRCTTC